MIRRIKAMVVCLFAGVLLSSQLIAQTVSLNVPTAWSTLRNDSVQVKAQIDTAGLKQKQVNYTLSSVISGVSKIISKKQVKIKDVSSDVLLAKVKNPVIGGSDFLKIEWAADSQKGEILPFGIVNLNKIPKREPVKAKSVDDGVTLKAIVENVKDEQFYKCGAKQYAVLWNSKALFFVAKKTADTSSLVFALDGKNGKNAFVSFPDRFVVCKKDSVWGTHYKRDIEKAALKYTSQNWNTEITKEVIGDKIVIRMPWYDSGIVPFGDRMVGFAVFAKDKDKVVSSSPEKAMEFIPGTWGNLTLAK